MAYLGYLFKVNGVIFPLKYIALNTYKITPNQTQDEDSYEDGDGKLHRNILPHRRSKGEFNTPPLNEANNRIVQDIFPDLETVPIEYWNPRKGIYETGTCYTPDFAFEIIKTTDTDLLYNPLRIAFIEY